MLDVLALISSGTVSSGSDSFLVSPSDSCKDDLNNERQEILPILFLLFFNYQTPPLRLSVETFL